MFGKVWWLRLQKGVKRPTLPDHFILFGTSARLVRHVKRKSEIILFITSVLNTWKRLVRIQLVFLSSWSPTTTSWKSLLVKEVSIEHLAAGICSLFSTSEVTSKKCCCQESDGRPKTTEKTPKKRPLDESEASRGQALNLRPFGSTMCWSGPTRWPSNPEFFRPPRIWPRKSRLQKNLI